MKVLKCCKMNFTQWWLQPKYIIAAVFLFLQMWNMFMGMGDYSRAIGFKLHPWLFPLLPADYRHFALCLFPFVLLINDAPLRNRQQQFVFQRVGKTAWISGQLLFVVCISFLYTATLWLLSWVMLLPYMEWGSDWGIALNTAAQRGMHYQYCSISLHYDAIKGVTPLEASAWVAFSLFFVLILLGEIMILCNLWLGKGIGSAVVSFFVVLSMALRYFSTRIPRLFVWFSPVSWTDRTLMGKTGQRLPPYGYAAGMAVGLCILLGLVIVGTIHRCNLETKG